jgi:hypothetical protein
MNKKKSPNKSASCHSFSLHLLIMIHHSGKAFRTCYARIFDILLNISFNKRAEDIQNRARESL